MNELIRGILISGLCAASWAVVGAHASAQTPSASSEPVEAANAEDIVSEPPTLPSEDVVREALATGAAEHLASEDQQALLGEWMEHTASVGRRNRLYGGANNLIASSITMGIGIALFVTNPNTELSKGLGLAMVGTSGVFMSLGIFQLAKESQAELRLERWRRAASSRLTLQELGRFEGELRAQSVTKDRDAKMGRWSSFGLAMTGALILGLTPAANLSSDASTASYIVGGVMAGFGLFGFGLSFTGGGDNPYEAYMRGQRPLQYGRRATVRVAPAAGRRFVGAQVIGRF